MRKIIAVMALTGGLLVGCSGMSAPACADILPKTGSGSGARPTPPKSGTRSGSSGGSKSSGSKSSGSRSSTPRSAQQKTAARNSNPKHPPSKVDSDLARNTAPATVSRTGSYQSQVTGNTYVFHSVTYYRRPGIFVDFYDPYNPYNYWYWDTSPFYGRPYMYARECGAEQRTVVEQKQNITIVVDDDGKIKESSDKNDQDPDLSQPTEHDDESNDPNGD